MKIIKILQDFEFTASGGIAIYLLLCSAYVTIVGFFSVIYYLVKFARKVFFG